MSLLKIAISVLGLLGATHAVTRSPGCGLALGTGIRTGVTGQSNSLSITSNGLTRTFLLHIPTNYAVNDPRGLVFSFHGRTRTAASQEALSSFSDPYFNPDMLAVYPQGVDQQWQGDPVATTNDILFTLDLLTYINNNYCINTEAVYSTGKSNGAGFSLNILSCDSVAVTKFAAFAGAASADCRSASNRLPSTFTNAKSRSIQSERGELPGRISANHLQPRKDRYSNPRVPRNSRRHDSLQWWSSSDAVSSNDSLFHAVVERSPRSGNHQSIHRHLKRQCPPGGVWPVAGCTRSGHSLLDPRHGPLVACDDCQW